MEIRSAKLPPLPNRRSPIQAETNSEKVILPGPRITSYSREKYLRRSIDERPSSEEKEERRPVSVREKSVDSVRSRQSIEKKSYKEAISQGKSSTSQSMEIKRKKSMETNIRVQLSLPAVSAKSWGVFEINQEKFIYGKRIFKKRQIASLTKIMNFVTILQILQKNKLQPHRIQVKVSKEASCLNGTTAELKPGFILNLEQLFYGMMLPSGNDAAHQIAEVGGAIIQMEKNIGFVDKKLLYNVQEFAKFYQDQGSRIKNYLSLMNKIAKKIQMTSSNFANPHGLSNPDNYSCVEDIGKLSMYAMKNQTFRTVVYTKFYKAKYKFLVPFQVQFQEEEEICKNSEMKEDYLQWQNTNKMLNDGWSGIKTGVTPNAGPCLSASIKKYVSGGYYEFLVVLINSKSMQARWVEVKEIVDWAVSQEIYSDNLNI